MKKIDLLLPNGKKIKGDKFTSEDMLTIQAVYIRWLEINKFVNALDGRSLNVPEVVSEGLYSLYFNAVRTPRCAGSFDCVNINDKKGIQIKATSIENDCTSFGPRTDWDELYFMDFAPNGIVNGIVDVYKIDFPLDDIILNEKTHETFKDQQNQGRRPRLSIKRLLHDKGIKPVKTIKILDDEM